MKFENVKRRIAWLLPRDIAYWAAIRVGCNATQGEHSNQCVPEPLFMDSLKRWEKNQSTPPPSVLTRARKRFGLLLAGALALFAMSAPALGAAPPLPNAKETPGAVSPIVSAENLSHTVCASGYTEKIRPPSSYTSYVKKRQLSGKLSHGVYTSNASVEQFEEDHLVPLCAGGHPTALGNLWPEPRGPGNDEKDACEHRVCRAICAGKVALADAQKGFSSNWVAFCRSSP